MVHHWWIVLIQITLFYSMSLAAEETGTEESNEKSSHDIKKSFDKLLGNIVEVNEKRIDSIKNIMQLQDFILTKNKIRSQDDFIDDDADEEVRNHNAILELIDKQNRLPLRRSKPEEYSDLSKAIKLVIFQKNIPKKKARNPLHKQFVPNRRSWHDKCNKRAAKVCKTACTRAFKNSCMTYKCSKRAKRTFRRQCTRSCKQKFEADRQDSDE